MKYILRSPDEKPRYDRGLSNLAKRLCFRHTFTCIILALVEIHLNPMWNLHSSKGGIDHPQQCTQQKNARCLPPSTRSAGNTTMRKADVDNMIAQSVSSRSTSHS